ncbi:MAG: hypothetical protein PHV30_08525 [Candidatus Margulisbacteria bacterium]|nr:hypothetical protein [Candidatus Margulisiibacteriota bacterium]
MGKNMNARFDYLLNTILNNDDSELSMELSKEEKEFFKSIDLTEVLFI